MKYRGKFLIGILLLFQWYQSLAQNDQVYWDSLEQASMQFPADTSTVLQLNSLFDHYSSSGQKQALPYIERAWRLADSLAYPKGLALTALNLAIAHDMQGNYYKAFKKYHEALRLAEEIGNEDYRSRCLLSMGYFYSTQGNYEKAIECTLESALIDQELYGINGPSYAWCNLGYYYLQNKQFDSARFYTLKSYEIFKTEQDSSGQGDVYFNLGNLAWEAERDASKALKYCLKAQEMFKSSSFGHIETLAECQARIGFFYTQLNKFRMADQYLDKALKNARKNNLRYIRKVCYFNKSVMHEAAGDFRQAFEYLRNYLALHDSLHYQQSVINLQQIQNEYELETQQAKISLLNQDTEMRKDELSRQLLIRNSFIVMVGMLLVLAAVLYRNNFQKQKHNSVLLKQKEEIEEKSKAIVRKNQMLQEQKRAMLMQSRSLHEANQQNNRQKEIIERKNKDITDSLNYARQIQSSMLPEVEQLRQRIPDAFVWLHPRDIVSGDFFWFDEQDDKLFIAAVDCTGHGVPGAFMSLIGNSYLSQIVRIEKEYEPHRILSRLSEHVSRVLKQDVSNNQDGMEMSLCVIDRKNKELHFAGARNHLLYVQNEQLYKIKGDRLHIGGKSSNAEACCFTRHTIRLNRPTKFYLYTDGIRDQFGGPEDKKFREKQLTSLVLEISHLPMSKQRMLIRSRLDEWMEGYEQVDDILMIGWSLP